MKNDEKLFAGFSKAEMATDFVNKSNRIAELKLELKKLSLEVEAIEEILLPQIGLKYQPKGAEFILMPKKTKGRKSTSYAKVVELVPEACSLNAKQQLLLKDLVASQTKVGEDTKSIQIIQ
jgi:hypothetical protein